MSYDICYRPTTSALVLPHLLQFKYFAFELAKQPSKQSANIGFEFAHVLWWIGADD
jgi:hypothetical protein